MDLFRGQSFVLPIVPFNEVGIDFSLRAEARELAGLSGAMKRARQNQRERRPFQEWFELSGDVPTVLRQRDVGRAGVLSAPDCSNRSNMS